jgi:hypothetical protein
MSSPRLALSAIACTALGAAPTTASPAASVGPLTAPDTFDVSGDGLHVTYETTGPDGQPHLRYESADKTMDFSGREIRTEASGDLGTLVSVSIWRTIDSGSASFTLILPRVVLGPRDEEVHIEVVGITTAHRFSVVRMLNRGQLDASSQVALSGTARATVHPAASE